MNWTKLPTGFRSTTLDTASLYGHSENAIGQYLSNSHNQFKIITKTPTFQSPVIGRQEINNLENTFFRSLEKLKAESVHGLLVHHAADLAKPGCEFLVEKMNEFKLNKKTNYIGVSVYTGKEIDMVLNAFTPDIIQMPISVFDQRLIASGHLQMLNRLGIEVHARSIFMQGLLLMELDKIPGFFSPIVEQIREYHYFLEETGLSKLEGALKFIDQFNNEIELAIIGVNSKEQLTEIVKANGKLPKDDNDMTLFAVNNEKILNPSNWETA